MEPTKNGEKAQRDKKGRYLQGHQGGPGRPQGSVSVIGKIKQKFEENPDYFDEWINEFIADPAQRKAIMEQIDGKPKQSMDVDVKFPESLIELMKQA